MEWGSRDPSESNGSATVTLSENNQEMPQSKHGTSVNSAKPDQAPHNAATGQVLHC